MNPETTAATCSLCKRPLTEVELTAARLCSQCQSIVKNVLPGNDAKFATTPLQPVVVDVAPPARESSPSLAEPRSDNGEPIIRFDEADTPVAEQPIVFDTAPLAKETRPAPGKPKNSKGTLESALRDPKSKGALEGVLRESGALRQEPPGPQPSLSEEFETLKRSAENSEPLTGSAGNAKPVASSKTFVPARPVASVKSPVAQNPASEGNSRNLNHSAGYSAERQPVRRPINESRSKFSPPQPAWNNVELRPRATTLGSVQQSSGRWKVIAAVILVLALGAAGAAYLLVIKQKRTQASQHTDARSQSHSSSASTSDTPAASAATSSPVGANAAVPASNPTGVSGAATTTRTDPSPADATQPRYSLQAASLPNQSAASEFAERLVRAGVPAYVVAADLPGRGRWYRVRVGRFGTQDEASKFVADAKLRARTAGIALTLVPCDYDKPEK